MALRIDLADQKRDSGRQKGLLGEAVAEEESRGYHVPWNLFPILGIVGSSQEHA